MRFWPKRGPEKASVTVDSVRIDALERRCGALEADAAALRREWADTLDKLQTWFGRQAARKRQHLHRELEREHAEDQETAQNGAGSTINPAGMTKAELRSAFARTRLGGGKR